MRVKDIFVETDLENIIQSLEKLNFYKAKFNKKIKRLINSIIESQNIKTGYCIGLDKYNDIRIYKEVSPIKLETNKYHHVSKIANMYIMKEMKVLTHAEICAKILEYISQDFELFTEPERKYYYDGDRYKTFIDPVSEFVSMIVTFLISQVDNQIQFVLLLSIGFTAGILLIDGIRNKNLSAKMLFVILALIALMAQLLMLLIIVGISLNFMRKKIVIKKIQKELFN
ncbi:hypothetical protein [Alkaliphilus sp. B6464]|uniref:hypothetical protein n=1 Tax=Alkaliphilus sp. B6464 TaxID=2731219 RepID=UPI001BACA4C0|nr:hypothetical protein [Alkaliphilus sp. B6464]QUH21914.1 hypothetical protein HYG84_18435 [Alkaliphilus sp. B6464]